MADWTWAFLKRESGWAGDPFTFLFKTVALSGIELRYSEYNTGFASKNGLAVLIPSNCWRQGRYVFYWGEGH